MKMRSVVYGWLLLAGLGLLGPTDAFAYSAIQNPQPLDFTTSPIPNKADNLEIRIVPAPGPVTVDGDLKDWDLSGAIFMWMDEASKDANHVRAAMMYDKECVYIGGVWKDPTPMMNMTHFGGDLQNAWNADAIQVRFLSDPSVMSDAINVSYARFKMPADQQKFVNHINLWYSTQDQKAGYQASYTLDFADGVLNPEGVQGAYVKDADGKGCTFEYRIPLKVLRAPRPYQADDTVQMQFEVHWGNEKGTELKFGLSDVRNPYSSPFALGFMGPNSWGLGRFMATGNLPPVVKKVMDRAGGRNSAVLLRLSGAAADGKDGEWQDMATLPIGDSPPSREASAAAPGAMADKTAGQGKEKPARVHIGYDNQNLYARFEVQLGVPFLNTPTDYKLLFKSGSSLEICLTPNTAERKVGSNNHHPMEVGDLRVLIARTKAGKLIATRYRPKIEAAEKPLAAFFETPAAGREDFDEIAEWNDLPMNYREIEGGCIVEVAIPWAATALKPAAGLKFLLDAGVIYGNEGGTRNATRAPWSDQTPEVNVNNDIPTESRMHPNGWGLVAVE